MQATPIKMMAWGTYDLGKPRVRILLRGLRENQVMLTECHYHLWKHIEDKTQFKGLLAKFNLILKWVFCYPSLIVKFLKAEPQQAILLPYFAYADILVLWPFAKLRRTPIILDAFIPIYDTFVHDRKMLSRFNPIAWLIWVWEWLALSLANLVIFDTQAHQRYFCQEFGISEKKCAVVYVGVEQEFFKPALTKPSKDNNRTTVLFYGQFIPLHGIETIIEAAQLSDDYNIDWVLIGTGQEANKIQKMLDEKPVKNLQWIKWVNYEELNSWIQKADICLGIFGKSEKANRVIPNKVFQILASGKPLITRNSDAMRELPFTTSQSIRLLSIITSPNLLDAIRSLIATGEKVNCTINHEWSPTNIGKQTLQCIKLNLKQGLYA